MKRNLKIIVLQVWTMCEWASKLPKNSIFNEKPQPGMLLTGHPCGVNWHADMEFVTDARIFFLIIKLFFKLWFFLGNIHYPKSNPSKVCDKFNVCLHEQHFWTNTDLTYDTNLTSTQRPFWSHGSAEHYKIMTLIQDLPHPCWIFPYIGQSKITESNWQMWSHWK